MITIIHSILKLVIMIRKITNQSEIKVPLDSSISF